GRASGPEAWLGAGVSPNLRTLIVLLFGEKLGLSELGFLLGECRLRCQQLVLEVADGLEEIVASSARRLGSKRIVEVIGVGNPGALLLGPDLGVEVVMLAHQIANHGVNVAHLPALLLGAETMKAEKRIARTHGHLVNSLTHRHTPYLASGAARPQAF